MSGRTMDLLPDAIRQNVQRAEDTQRIIVVGLISASLLIGAWIHGGIRASDAENRRTVAMEKAEEVLKAEQKTILLHAQLNMISDEIQAYRAIQIPFNISSLLATVVDEMPDSVTLSRIDLDASSLIGSPVRSGKGNELTAPPARLRGELEGVAANDVDVATLVESLRNRNPIGGVEVETSRHVEIEGQSARAFQIGFVINLEDINPKTMIVKTAEANND